MTMIKRVLLIGGPGSGKSSLIQKLENLGYQVHHEISRTVIRDAQEQGIQQLFLADPFAFSEKLLAGRIKQYHQATTGINFYDRGVPDVPAYHIFKGEDIPVSFIDACKDHTYDFLFFLPPWQEIYTADNERYETYEQAIEIGDILLNFYKNLDYQPIILPLTSIDERVALILKHLTSDKR